MLLSNKDINLFKELMHLISSELNLLILCMQMQFNPALAQKPLIDYIEEKDINWNSFLTLASEHKIVSIAYKQLLNIPMQILPRPIINSLSGAYYAIATRHIILLNELKYIINLLGEHTIPVIPFKGAAIAQLYDNATLRQYGDLDIIVKKEDLNKVKKILIDNEYVYFPISISSSSGEGVEDHKDLFFFKEDRKVALDVHWCLAEPNENFCYPMEGLWAQAYQQSFFGEQVLMLDYYNLIITTCIHHGIRNSWNEFKYISDLAMLIRGPKDFDWKALIEKTENLDLMNSLLVGASLVNTLLRLELPPELQRAIEYNTKVKRLETLIITEIFKKKSNLRARFYNIYVQILLRQRLRTRMFLFYIFLKHVIKPNELDEKFIKFPNNLRFLRVFLRPFRLANKYMKFYRRVG